MRELCSKLLLLSFSRLTTSALHFCINLHSALLGIGSVCFILKTVFTKEDQVHSLPRLPSKNRFVTPLTSVVFILLPGSHAAAFSSVPRWWADGAQGLPRICPVFTHRSSNVRGIAPPERPS